MVQEVLRHPATVSGYVTATRGGYGKGEGLLIEKFKQ
jgi:hypothetical protein